MLNTNRSNPEALKRIRSMWVLYGVLLVNIIVIVLFIIMIINPETLLDKFVDELGRLPEWRPSPWPTAPSPATIAGCYELSFEKWFPERDVSGDISYLTVPIRIELTTEPGQEGGQGAFVMRPAPGVAPSIHLYSFWYITSERTILLRWSTGSSSLSADMGPVSGGLWGIARTWFDYPGHAQITRVSAKRIACLDKDEK